jgi:hypothetical protein
MLTAGKVFAHVCTPCMRQDTVSKVAVRTPTSIFLLGALLVGILSPTGMCALMCERHSRTESQIRCGQHQHAMHGMTHDHAAMNHPGIHPEGPVMASHSCPSNCHRPERLNLSREVAPQVTAGQAGVVVLNTTAKFLAPDTSTAWSSDGSHAPPTAYAASFTVLRI